MPLLGQPTLISAAHGGEPLWSLIRRGFPGMAAGGTAKLPLMCSFVEEAKRLLYKMPVGGDFAQLRPRCVRTLFMADVCESPAVSSDAATTL